MTNIIHGLFSFVIFVFGASSDGISNPPIVIDVSPTPVVQQAPYFPPEQGYLSREEVLQVTRYVGIPSEIENSFIAILMCESGFNRYAKGDYDPYLGIYNSLGLMQMNRHWFSEGEDPFDPVTNISKAYWLYGRLGNVFRHSGGWLNCAIKNGIW